jgi:hypothetical protein
MASGELKVRGGNPDKVALHAKNLTVEFSNSTKTMIIDSTEWSIHEWQTLVKRIDKVMVREEWFPKPEGEAIHGGRSSSFLTRNVDKIVSLKGGIMLVLPKYIPILRAVVLGGANGKRGV